MKAAPGLTSRKPHTAARSPLPVIFRSAALFAVLYQFRFLAGDLADTAVFAVTLCAAFASAVFFARKLRPLPAAAAIALVPWIARAFIAAPGFFLHVGNNALPSVEQAAVTLDSLLLNFDRNNFVSLLPFYWVAATAYFSIRSRLFLRAAVIADAAILVALFGFTGLPDSAAYRWPVVMIVLLTCVIFLQLLALLFSLPPEFRLRKRERIAAIAALLILVFSGGLIFLKPAQERAVQKGGGLLEPKLFSFDFSQFLRLDTEISMSDDLILIVKKDPADSHILLRRSVLSGYSQKQGFYRVEETDERTHPQRLPSRPVRLAPAGFKLARQVNQEYFLVNFDAAAFIGMKEPVEIIPYESWDSSSFKSAYSVESLASDAYYEDFSGSAWPGPAELGLSRKEFALYTAWGDDLRIRSLAEEITEGLDLYADKVQMIHDWLKYGDYRYSLKPGIAPDGDQLAWFLFNSKKGYCSYYAFSMALLLRSLGIPARVAAGFFIDPEAGTFDYYPVRADMAHAWVEVPFPGYGWIEFDPTTEYLAEGEEFRFSSGVDPVLFERLMREILENRSNLRIKTGQDETGGLKGGNLLARLKAVLAKRILLPLLPLLLVISFLLIRCGFLLLSVMCRRKRKKAVYLWKHARRRLRLAGFGGPATSPAAQGPMAESEWALQADAAVSSAYAMYLAAAAARFAPAYGKEDFASLLESYRIFSGSYRKNIPLLRRLLAWILPPAAALKSRRFPRPAGLAVFLVLAFLAVTGGGAQDAGPGEPVSAADELYLNAIDAEYAEYWERAIGLYREGGEKYPGDPRFPWALGNLYYSRSLYSLAWDEYRKTETLLPGNTDILLRLANTAGYLNRDKISVGYLERLLAIEPGNREAISSLGWMYYKVHRLADGERLLTSALERFGDEADLAMTLGTVYSDMYRYDEGKGWYKKAIEQARVLRNFTAVAHYNLSILESRFYHYDLSMDEANASLDSQYRASGLLARGELYMRRLDLEGAQADYQAAREIDHSPLAKLNLAQVYQISGRLEEARLYAEDCLKTGDHSWMMNYGIDPVRYRRDIHEILYKTYAGLAEAERFLPRGTTGEKIYSLYRLVYARFYSGVHSRLYRKYSLAAGDAYNTEPGSPPLDRYIQYYNAFETYPRRALFWLNRARDFETAIIPASRAAHYLEEGILLKNKALAAKALEGLDSVWERELVSQCYREFARSREKNRVYAEELFSLNRGALLQAGIALPAELSLAVSESAGGKNPGRIGKTFRRIIGKAGFAPAENSGAGIRFALNITVSESPSGAYAASCELADREGTVKTVQRVLPLKSLSKKDICAFARELSGIVFTVE